MRFFCLALTHHFLPWSPYRLSSSAAQFYIGTLGFNIFAYDIRTNKKNVFGPEHFGISRYFPSSICIG